MSGVCNSQGQSSFRQFPEVRMGRTKWRDWGLAELDLGAGMGRVVNKESCKDRSLQRLQVGNKKTNEKVGRKKERVV